MGIRPTYKNKKYPFQSEGSFIFLVAKWGRDQLWLVYLCREPLSLARKGTLTPQKLTLAQRTIVFFRPKIFLIKHSLECKFHRYKTKAKSSIQVCRRAPIRGSTCPSKLWWSHWFPTLQSPGPIPVPGHLLHRQCPVSPVPVCSRTF